MLMCSLNIESDVFPKYRTQELCSEGKRVHLYGGAAAMRNGVMPVQWEGKCIVQELFVAPAPFPKKKLVSVFSRDRATFGIQYASLNVWPSAVALALKEEVSISRTRHDRHVKQTKTVCFCCGWEKGSFRGCRT